MLDGFGLVPVCLDLNLDSYDGSPTHVMRFRGREGWLAVAELQIEGRRKRWTVPFAVGCDEYFHPIPHFMVPNLLACACSYPSPCTDIPPYELDHLLEEAEEQVLRRWLRNQSSDLRDFHEQGAQQLAALEGQTDRRLRAIDRQILQLQRDRRTAKYDLELREEVDAAILRLEVEQDALISALRAERLRLRTALEDEEDALLDALDVSTRIAKLYEVQWRGRCAQEPALEEARELAAELQRLFPAGLYAAPADKNEYLTAAELETLERFSKFRVTALGDAGQSLPLVVPEPASDPSQRKPAVADQSPSKDSIVKPSASGGNGEAESSKPRAPKPAAVLTAREYEKLVVQIERLAVQERQFRASAEQAQGKAWQHRLLMHANRCRKHINALKAQLFPWALGEATFNETDATEGVSEVCSQRLAGGLDQASEPSVGPTATAVLSPANVKQIGNDSNGAERHYQRAAKGPSWTEPQVELLRSMWMEGLPAGEIAVRLGKKSRNIVIGKAYRMGLPVRTNGKHATGEPKDVSEAV
jgi:hypothetical protein